MSLKNLELYKSHIHEYGFSVINHVFSNEEVEELINVLNRIDTSREKFLFGRNGFILQKFHQ